MSKKQNLKALIQILFCILLFNPVAGQTDYLNNETEKIIFDTNMGSDCDDVDALALLHYYADVGKAEIVGCIYSSGKVPFGPGIVEAINIWYGRPDIPVGAYHGSELGDPDDKMTAEKLANFYIAPAPADSILMKRKDVVGIQEIVILSKPSSLNKMKETTSNFPITSIN